MYPHRTWKTHIHNAIMYDFDSLRSIYKVTLRTPNNFKASNCKTDQTWILQITHDALMTGGVFKVLIELNAIALKDTQHKVFDSHSAAGIPCHSIPIAETIHDKTSNQSLKSFKSVPQPLALHRTRKNRIYIADCGLCKVFIYNIFIRAQFYIQIPHISLCVY